MKLITLWSSLASLTAIIYCDSLTTRNVSIKQHKSIVYENQTKLTGSDDNGRDYVLTAQKNKANLKFNNGGKGYETQVVEGMAGVKDVFTGQQASVNKVGAGGMAQAGIHRGTMRNNKESGDDVVYLDGDSGPKLTAKKIGVNKSFVAQSANNNWELNPSFQNLTDGKGTIVKDGKPFNYQLSRQVNGDASVSFRDNSSSSIFSKSSQYTCKAQTIGISTCFDEYGKKIGEVRASNNGEVTITDKAGVPLATAKASKDKDGKPVVVVNNGLIVATSDKQQDFNCPGVSTNFINISKPLYFKYANQKKTTDGGVQYDWPSCFELEADIVLKSGIEAKNLAFKWTVNVLPLGRLNCNNAASNLCSKGSDCYYCNLCDPKATSKSELLTNVMTNLCEARGGNAFTIKAKVCPPPEVNQFFLCDEFTKGLNDVYWKKKGDLDVIFEVYNRKSDAEFKTDWQDLIQRATLIAGYKSDPNVYEKLESILTIPTEEEVKQWYKLAKAEKIACHESIVSYSLSGTKIETDFLLEAATIGGIFKKTQCKNDTSNK